jgi:hypothetical protein
MHPKENDALFSCSRPRPRARPRKAEAREGITRYSVDDEDDVTSDENFVLLLVLGKYKLEIKAIDELSRMRTSSTTRMKRRMTTILYSSSNRGHW